MSTTSTLSVIAGAVSVLNGLISLSENSEKYRAMIAEAIAKGGDLSEEQLESLRLDAIEAIEAARAD